MNQYMLLLRSEKIDFGSYSQEDFSSLLADFDAWNARLEVNGLLASAGLSGAGARTARSGENGVTIDGPFCETKEAITGICIINSVDADDALELASVCPFVKRGGSVEVRAISQLEINSLFKEVSGDAKC